MNKSTGFTTAPDTLLPWVHENAARGMSRLELHENLVSNGYDPVFASSFLAKAFAGLENTSTSIANVADSQRLAAQAWWARHAELRSCNHLALCDADARIMVSNHAIACLYISNLLSSVECEALIAEARKSLTTSQVVDPSTGAFVSNVNRKSEGSFFRRDSAPKVVAQLQQRLSWLTSIDTAFFEELQTLHYGQGGEYKVHSDYFDPALPGSASQTRRGGQRLLTIICYLNDVSDGGGTEFPALGLQFQPTAGSVLVFSSLDEHGVENPSSMHAGMPVIEGEKWITTQWIRCEKAF